MMTAYVILSRIKAATGLLLLRAFAPDLFKMGPVAGPHCLIKLLRARLSSSSIDTSYTSMEARAEYGQRMEEYEAWRAHRRTHGSSWVCAECKHSMPAEEYGAKITCTDDIYRFCLAPGQWRRCNVCSKKDRERADEDISKVDLLQCHGCNQMRADRYFTAGISPIQSISD